mgnify:CR=1 FL=1
MMQVIITDRNGVPVTSIKEDTDKAWTEAKAVTGKEREILEDMGYSAKMLLTEA